MHFKGRKKAKCVSTISFAEKKSTDQVHWKAAGKTAYAQLLKEKRQFFKGNHLFSCLSICLGKGKTTMDPS